MMKKINEIFTTKQIEMVKCEDFVVWFYFSDGTVATIATDTNIEIDLGDKVINLRPIDGQEICE